MDLDGEGGDGLDLDGLGNDMLDLGNLSGGRLDLSEGDEGGGLSVGGRRDEGDRKRHENKRGREANGRTVGEQVFPAPHVQCKREEARGALPRASDATWRPLAVLSEFTR